MIREITDHLSGDGRDLGVWPVRIAHLSPDHRQPHLRVPARSSAGYRVGTAHLLTHGLLHLCFLETRGGIVRCTEHPLVVHSRVTRKRLCLCTPHNPERTSSHKHSQTMWRPFVRTLTADPTPFLTFTTHASLQATQDETVWSNLTTFLHSPDLVLRLAPTARATNAGTAPTTAAAGSSTS